MLYTLLKDVFFLMEDGDRQHFNHFDLTTPRYYALKHIGENPGVSLSQLSVLTLSDKGNVSRIVRGLEADGLVSRQQDQTDGRALCLYLTDEGRRLHDAASTSHLAFNHARMAGIDAKFDTLLETLEEVKVTLDQHLNAAKAAG